MSSHASFPAPATASLQVANAHVQFRRLITLTIVFFCAPFGLAASPILLPVMLLDSTMRGVIPKAFHRKTYAALRFLFHFLPTLMLLDPLNACKPHPQLKANAVYRFGFYLPYEIIVQGMEIWKWMIGLHYRGFNALAAAEKTGLIPELAVWWRILYALSVGPLIVGLYLELLFRLLDPFADWLMHPYRAYYWQPRLDQDIAARRLRLDREMQEQLAALRARESRSSEDDEYGC